MFIGITGARIFLENDMHKVEYQNTIIFESKSKSLSIIIALCKKKCDELLTLKTNQV
jgi:hypothetical protein